MGEYMENDYLKTKDYLKFLEHFKEESSTYVDDSVKNDIDEYYKSFAKQYLLKELDDGENVIIDCLDGAEDIKDLICK